MSSKIALNTKYVARTLIRLFMKFQVSIFIRLGAIKILKTCHHTEKPINMKSLKSKVWCSVKHKMVGGYSYHRTQCCVHCTQCCVHRT